MINRSTASIMTALKMAIYSYDEKCRELFQGPSQKAINRKVEFALLLGQLADKTPEEAVKTIYRFYENNSNDSRLLEEIRKALFSLFNIKTNPVHHSRYFSCKGCQAETIRWRLFHEKLDKVKIPQKELDKYETRKMARMIGQGMRSESSPFWDLPEDLLKIIMAISVKELSKDEVWEIAKENLNKPKI